MRNYVDTDMTEEKLHSCATARAFASQGYAVFQVYPGEDVAIGDTIVVELPNANGLELALRVAAPSTWSEYLGQHENYSHQNDPVDLPGARYFRVEVLD